MKLYHFKISQCVSGVWQEMIKVETGDKLTSVGATKHLEEFTEKVYKSPNMFITVENKAIIFNVDKWPVKIELIEGPIP